MSARRQMKPWEVVATLLGSGQLQLVGPVGDDYRAAMAAGWRVAVVCLRSHKEITRENVRTIQVEHWPIKHEHGGPVSPDNAVISLSEGHKAQTKREARDKSHERKLRMARLAKADVEKRIGKEPKWRLKRKIDGSVVRVRTS